MTSRAAIAAVDLASEQPNAELRKSLIAALAGPYSAALVKLSSAQSNDLRALHVTAARFFAMPDSRKRQAVVNLHHPSIGSNPVLQGYREPSAAKQLLRLFSGSRFPPGLPLALRRAAKRGAGVLEAVLMGCVRSILSHDVRGQRQRPLSARTLRRVVRSNRVLDLFLYDNRHGCSTPNCLPHVDRGLLHAIVASPVDGLELQSAVDGTWAAPHVLWPETTPHEHVIVFVNDALQRLSEGWAAQREPGEDHGEELTRLVACTHRVVRSAAGAVPRLSISFELRPAADADERDLAELAGRTIACHSESVR